MQLFFHFDKNHDIKHTYEEQKNMIIWRSKQNRLRGRNLQTMVIDDQIMQKWWNNRSPIGFHEFLDMIVGNDVYYFEYYLNEQIKKDVTKVIMKHEVLPMQKSAQQLEFE